MLFKRSACKRSAHQTVPSSYVSKLSSKAIHQHSFQRLHSFSDSSMCQEHAGKTRSQLQRVSSAVPGPTVELVQMKAQLASYISRLNSTSGTSSSETSALLELVDCLAALNPTSNPSSSHLINGRWALLYTTSSVPAQWRQRQWQRASAAVTSSPAPAADQADTPMPALSLGKAHAVSSVQGLSDAAYKFFYRYVPLLAGSAVGRRGALSGGSGNGEGGAAAVRSRGNFQTFDTTAGVVKNQARFVAFGCNGEINVDGTAEVVSQPVEAPPPLSTMPLRIDAPATSPLRRLKATFTSFELVVEGRTWLRLPLSWLNPVGYVDTPYLDEELRISVGDKGSLFIARRVAAEAFDAGSAPDLCQQVPPGS